MNKLKNRRYKMQIRLLKISEFDKLIDAIRKSWNPNHVYCRNPELLKYMVYNTPYRKDFCGNDEETTYFVMINKNKIIGYSGFIPLEGNLFGKTVAFETTFHVYLWSVFGITSVLVSPHSVQV